MKRLFPDGFGQLKQSCSRNFFPVSTRALRNNLTPEQSRCVLWLPRYSPHRRTAKLTYKYWSCVLPLCAFVDYLTDYRSSIISKYRWNVLFFTLKFIFFETIFPDQIIFSLIDVTFSLGCTSQFVT